jgi:ribonuclease P/MRP protein subunit POP5
MKHLPKYLQPRWRYLAVAIESWPDATIDRDTLQRELWYAAQNLVGDVGSAELDLSVIQFRFTDGRGEAMVRTRRDHTESARAVIACLTSLGGEPIGVRVRGISGTVRACEEKYMGRQPETSAERDVAFANASRSAYIWTDRVDVRTDDGFAGATPTDLN